MMVPDEGLEVRIREWLWHSLPSDLQTDGVGSGPNFPDLYA